MNVLLMGMPFATTHAPIEQFRSRCGHEVRVLIAEGTEELELDTAGRPFVERFDYTFSATETAEEVIARIRPDWSPDVLICWVPEMFPPPREIERCPIKTVAAVSDWNIYYPQLEYNLARYDLVLTDRLGSQVLDLPGAAPQYFFPLYSHRSTDHRKLDIKKDVDVVFLGNLNHAIHQDRARYLEAVAKLSDRYRIVIRGGVYGDEYVGLFNRSRIVLNRAVRREMNLRCFEAPACNTLLFLEEDNIEVRDWLRDREEVVLYRPDNLVELIEYYLNHPVERERVTRQGHARIQSLAGERRLDDLLNWIAEQPMGARAFEDFPEETRAYADIMQYSSSLVPGQHVANRATLERYVREFPDRPEFLVAAGCALLDRLAAVAEGERAGLTQTMLQQFKKACQLRKDCAVLWFNLALVCRHVNAAAEAGCLEMVLRTPSCDYGGLLMGEFKDPYYARWRRALALHEQRVEILWAAAAVRLAETYIQQERYEDARDLAARSMAWVSDVATAYRLRAVAESHLGRLEEAARWLGEGLPLSAFDNGYRMDLFRVLQALGRRDEARALADESARIFSCYSGGEEVAKAFREAAETI